MSAAELDRYRAAVCSPAGDDLAGIVATCSELGFDLAEESLKRIPNGFEIATGRETFLKRKGLVVLTPGSAWSHADIMDPDRRADALPRLAAVNNWLIRHVIG